VYIHLEPLDHMHLAADALALHVPVDIPGVSESGLLGEAEHLEEVAVERKVLAAGSEDRALICLASDFAFVVDGYMHQRQGEQVQVRL